jgi:hypothetical protein
MPTLAELLTPASNKKVNQMKAFADHQLAEDKKRIDDLIHRLAGHYPSHLEVMTPPDGSLFLIKYKEVTYKVKVYGKTTYIIPRSGGDKLTYEQFIEKNPITI